MACPINCLIIILFSSTQHPAMQGKRVNRLALTVSLRHSDKRSEQPVSPRCLQLLGPEPRGRARRARPDPSHFRSRKIGPARNCDPRHRTANSPTCLGLPRNRRPLGACRGLARYTHDGSRKHWAAVLRRPAAFINFGRSARFRPCRLGQRERERAPGRRRPHGSPSRRRFAPPRRGA